MSPITLSEADRIQADSLFQLVLLEAHCKDISCWVPQEWWVDGRPYYPASPSPHP